MKGVKIGASMDVYHRLGYAILQASVTSETFTSFRQNYRRKSLVHRMSCELCHLQLLARIWKGLMERN